MTPEQISALKATSGIIGILGILLFVAIDVFAFEVGGFATFSQDLLTLTRAWWPFLCILSFVFGALQQHIAVPGPPAGWPGHFTLRWAAWPPASFWYCGAFWALFWFAGRLVSWRWLWQTSSQD
jgi:hypothetical protein